MAGRSALRAPGVADGPSRVGEAIGRLRSDILRLHLAPGEPISERELERSYGISRTPIRAVLSRLMDEGLVVRTHRGHAVAPFDLAEIEQVFEFREHSEAGAVRLACARAGPDAIRAIQAELDESLDDFTPERWMEVGFDFHVRVAALAGNRFFTEAVRRATVRTLRARWLVASSEAGRRASYKDHGAILAAIEAGDAGGAAALAVAHSREIRQQVIAAIEAARPILGRRSFADGRPEVPTQQSRISSAS